MKLLRFVGKFFKIRYEYYQLIKFKENIERIYELKKHNILVAHRKSEKERLRIYVIEVNLLADILKKEKINEENVPGTCVSYPNKF